MVSTSQKKGVQSILAAHLKKLTITPPSASFSSSPPYDFDFAEVFGPIDANDQLSSSTSADPLVIHNRSHSFLGPSPRYTLSSSLPLQIEELETESENENEIEVIKIERKGKFGPGDFEILRMVGKGAFGKVFQVRKKGDDVNGGDDCDDGLYAMKVMRKDTIIKKNHVDYMKAERDILTKVTHPFIVQLRYSFQVNQFNLFIADNTSNFVGFLCLLVFITHQCQ